MIYNFSILLKDNSEDILEEFIDKHTIYIQTDDGDELLVLSQHYREILNTLSSDSTKEEILKIFEKVALYELSINLPHIIIKNEIYSLKNILITRMLNIEDNSNIVNLLSLFEIIDNKVSSIYLDSYINKLLSINNIRITSLSDILEKNIIKFYEYHLVWLNNLANCIRHGDLNKFPELDSKLCNFGKWLHNDAKSIIQNNSKYKSIHTLHDTLHLLSNKIYGNIIKNESHTLLTYLEKCELLSLSIGTELALVDNTILNKRVTKDPLTGALNRQALKSVFKNQYELSLATNNPFVLAICDLDYFKNINDNYGHIIGDKILKNFVKVIQKNIRNSDIVIRYGGEEFVIMLPAINKEKGLQVLEKIRKRFEDSSLIIDENIIKSTVSIGMMEIHPEQYFKSSFLDQFINIVDQKLYMAKNNGRNRVEVC